MVGVSDSQGKQSLFESNLPLTSDTFHCVKTKKFGIVKMFVKLENVRGISGKSQEIWKCKLSGNHMNLHFSLKYHYLFACIVSILYV